MCELIFFCIFNTQIHNTRFVKLPISNKNNVCYNDANCLHILCRSHTKKNVLLKLIEPFVCPHQPGFEPGWLRCIGDSATEHVSHSDFQPGWSQRQSAHVTVGRILTNRSSTNLLITGVSDKLKAVVRLNGGHIEQLCWLTGSFAAMLCYVAYAF